MRQAPRLSWAPAAAIAAVAAAALAAGIASGDDDPTHPLSAIRTTVPRVSRSKASRPQSLLIGHSVGGRPIHAVVIGDPHAARSVLVVSCIHGNEQAGTAVANWLAEHAKPAATALWIVPDLNPDGVAADTRQNAHRVDLNRNFPYRWQPLGTPGYLQYSGPRPLSEPEARAAASLITRIRPHITIWFHQPLGVVDESGGDPAVERKFARLVGLHLVRLTRYPGSAVGWENHKLPGSTAFVVELPPGPLSNHDTVRHAAAILRLAAASSDARMQ